MYIRLIPSILFVTLSLLFLIGCSEDSETKAATDQQQTEKPKELGPPDEQAHITGMITKQEDDKITVVEDPNEPAVTMKAEILLTDSTQYLVREGDHYRPAKKDDLKEGTKVEVWYQGIVQDSDPVLANGEYIVWEKWNE